MAAGTHLPSALLLPLLLLCQASCALAWVASATLASPRPLHNAASRLGQRGQPRRSAPCAASGLSMSEGVRVAVAGVCYSPMKGLECQAGGTATSQLGVVTCRADAPASNGLAVARMLTGKVVAVPPGVGDDAIAVGDMVVGAATAGAKQGGDATLDSASLVTLGPALSALSPQQAAVFPSLALLVVAALQTCGVPLASLAQDLKGKRALVAGCSGPVGTIALLILQAAGCQEVVPAVRAKGDVKTLEKLKLKSAPFFYCQDAIGLAASRSDIFVDALGSRLADGGSLLSTKYAAALHPAVALVVQDGFFSGIPALRSLQTSDPPACDWRPTPEGVEAVRAVVAILEANPPCSSAIAAFPSQPFTPGEWLEASAWPKDVSSGGRYGFGGESLWVGEEPEDETSQSQE